jgi:hypothetical protein
MWRQDAVERVWKEEQMPEERNSATIRPMCKKVNEMGCNSYQGTSLLNVTYKIFTQLVAKRLEPYVEETLGDYQCGFHRDRSATDRILAQE